MTGPLASNESTPAVSIGMPVYNGEREIRAALDTIVAQTFENFELIISDNASTDSTGEICREYAERDARIRYFRQPTNIGSMANFRFVLLQSVAEYFTWAAADDVKSPDFLAANLAFLKSHPEYLGSTSPVKFKTGDFDAEKMGDASIDEDDPNERIIRLFSTWHANGRFYSLFRRAPLLTWTHLDNFEFLGSDWTLLTHLAGQGKLHRHTDGWLELGVHGMSNSGSIFDRFRNRKIEWVLPFYVVTLDTMKHLKNASFKQKRIALKRLLKLNYEAVRIQVWMKRQAIRKRRKALEARIKNLFRRQQHDSDDKQ